MSDERLTRRNLMKGAVAAGLGAIAAGAEVSEAQVRSGAGVRRSPVRPSGKFKLPEVKTVADYQEAAYLLSERLKNDAAFRAQMYKDPLKTLKSVGLKGDGLRELIREDDWVADRIGKGGGVAEGCDIVTCVCTDACCVTCWSGTSSGKIANPGDLKQHRFGVKGLRMQVSPKRKQLIANLRARGHMDSPRTVDPGRSAPLR